MWHYRRFSYENVELKFPSAWLVLLGSQKLSSRLPHLARSCLSHSLSLTVRSSQELDNEQRFHTTRVPSWVSSHMQHCLEDLLTCSAWLSCLSSSCIPAGLFSTAYARDCRHFRKQNFLFRLANVHSCRILQINSEVMADSLTPSGVTVLPHPGFSCHDIKKVLGLWH